ncbi:uncharacterized protein LOC133517430 [Cydia pomonella]|uniref:uncharacterized protein LOC133517430 n=1 Tax=Cydia pomonella TaxID=82600 RepID=UPI002ADD6243|nr:uncharacterized protein LOC133517430 [Cydia pomonella]
MTEEHLIILVNKYKCLYDVSDSKYSDQVCKENAWEEISKVMKCTGKFTYYLIKLLLAVSFFSVTDCKKKWTRLRDNYRKSLKTRESKSGDAAKPKRAIKFEKELEFLRPFLDDNNRTSNVSDNESTATANVITDSELSSNTTAYSVNSERTLARKRTKPPTTGEVLEKYLKQQDVIEKSDPITSFFLSMAEIVRNFPRSLQLQVRRQVFDIVENAETTMLGQETSTASSSASFSSVGYASDYTQQQGYSTQM